MGASAPDSVKRLVDHFDQNRRVFLSPDYKEEQLRVSSGPSLSIRHSSFVIRTFPDESLGWDVANKAGLTEVFKPVIHEESIKVAGASKASGCTFRRIAATQLSVLTEDAPAAEHLPVSLLSRPPLKPESN